MLDNDSISAQANDPSNRETPGDIIRLNKTWVTEKVVMSPSDRTTMLKNHN